MDRASGRRLAFGEREVFLLDRQVTGSSWSVVESPGATPKRLTFYSMKGGVGRTTALAALAFHLARRGDRVLVVDLDLESPGLSALVPQTELPTHGITDWLVEDLVDQTLTR